MDARMRLRLFARLLLLQAAWSFERMQGLGFAFALQPWLSRVYGGAEERRAALERHAEYFNTQPYAASLIVGLVCGLEEKAAALPPDDRPAAYVRLHAVKKAAAAAIAGAADAFFWGALRPASAAASLCAAAVCLAAGREKGTAAAAAAGVYLLAYNAPALWLRWRGLSLGYEWGEKLPLKLKELSVQAWVARVRLAGAGLALVAFLRLAQDAGPGTRVFGAVAFGGAFAAYQFLPVRVTGMRLYAASCALGVLAGGAGWL